MVNKRVENGSIKCLPDHLEVIIVGIASMQYTRGYTESHRDE